MPVIELSEGTFRRLQTLAVPFVDTPESVILKLLDRGAGESLPAIPTNGQMRSGDRSNARILNPTASGDLRHTKVLEARFAGRLADKWNELLVIAHEEALAKLGSFDAVRRVTHSQIAPGNRDDSGYHYQQSLGFSIQYVDSNNAWRSALHLARHLHAPVEVFFAWREKDGAAYPGEFGLLKWSPEQNG